MPPCSEATSSALNSQMRERLKLSHAASRVAGFSFSLFFFLSFFWNQSVAAAATMPTAVSVSRWGLAVFGPPAEDLVGAVVATAARHAGRGLVDLESVFCEGRTGDRVKHWGKSDLTLVCVVTEALYSLQSFSEELVSTVVVFENRQHHLLHLRAAQEESRLDQRRTGPHEWTTSQELGDMGDLTFSFSWLLWIQIRFIRQENL